MHQLTQSRASQIDALLNSACADTLFSSDLGQIFARIPVADQTQIVPLQSKDFRNWLSYRCYSEHGVVPQSGALRQAVQSIGAATEFSLQPTIKRRLARRIASLPDKVLIDLNNRLGEAVEITADGWRRAAKITASIRLTSWLISSWIASAVFFS